MYTLIYTEHANQDIIEIFEFIAKDNILAARAYIKKLENRILLLKENPYIGHKPQYDNLISLELKVLNFGPYLIFYKIQEKEKHCNIIRIIHGARNYHNFSFQ